MRQAAGRTRARGRPRRPLAPKNHSPYGFNDRATRRSTDHAPQAAEVRLLPPRPAARRSWNRPASRRTATSGRSRLPVRQASARHHTYAPTESGSPVEEEPQRESAGFPHVLKAVLQHERPGLVGRAIAVRDKEWGTCGACMNRPSSTTFYDRTPASGRAGRPRGPPGAHRGRTAHEPGRSPARPDDTADVIPPGEDPRCPSVGPGPFVWIRPDQGAGAGAGRRTAEGSQTERRRPTTTPRGAVPAPASTA